MFSSFSEDQDPKLFFNIMATLVQFGEEVESYFSQYYLLHITNSGSMSSSGPLETGVPILLAASEP